MASGITGQCKLTFLLVKTRVSNLTFLFLSFLVFGLWITRVVPALQDGFGKVRKMSEYMQDFIKMITHIHIYVYNSYIYIYEIHSFLSFQKLF